ncbi:nucleolin 2 isoform X2 [Cryptomeria japonica]|nr:nucleolin 2 isoform X2 [Cryptomeria japonica]
MQDYAPSSGSSVPVATHDQVQICSDDGAKTSSKKLDMSIDPETESKNDNGEPISIVTHNEADERPIKMLGAIRRRKWISDNSSSAETKEPSRQHIEYEERNDSSGAQHSNSKGKSGSKRQRSPEPWTRRGHFRHDKIHADKKTDPPTGLHATRRLLQSAVREAVGPIGPINSKPIVPPNSKRLEIESSKKRLRSVVSTNVENSDSLSDVVEASNRPRALAKSLPAMAIALKAAAAAAEDVAKFKSTGSVFERLGKRFDSNLNELHETVKEQMLDNEGNDEENATTAVYQGHKHQHRAEIHKKLNRGLVDDVELTDRESIMPSDTIREGYDEAQEDARHMRHYGGASKRRKQFENIESSGVSRISKSKDRHSIQAQKEDKRSEESVTVQYRVAQNSQEVTRESRVQKTSAKTPSASREIVNISVNVNTWKPPHFQPASDSVATKSKTSNMDCNLLQDHTEMHVDGNFPDVIDMGLRGEAGKVIPAADPNSASNADNCSDIRNDTSASGVCSPVGTPDDSDSRTVFVSNVHFAATKEALSKHFSRFGEVVKVTIQTDAGNSQPKGSAYIEFASKEMAEMALALDETSFMSRMLKVMLKTASNAEHAILSRPPVRRPLPYFAMYSARSIYARGFQSAYRRGGYMSRPFGSRSLQWRRDKASGASQKSTVSAIDSQAATSSVPSSDVNPAGPTSSQSPRPLTYIRDVSKSLNENASQSQE